VQFFCFKSTVTIRQIEGFQHSGHWHFSSLGDIKVCRNREAWPAFKYYFFNVISIASDYTRDMVFTPYAGKMPAPAKPIPARPLSFKKSLRVFFMFFEVNIFDKFFGLSLNDM